MYIIELGLEKLGFYNVKRKTYVNYINRKYTNTTYISEKMPKEYCENVTVNRIKK